MTCSRRRCVSARQLEQNTVIRGYRIGVYQVNTAYMNTANVLEKLMKGGNSKERAEAIIKEAEASSNPEYILHYYGVK